MRCDEIQERFVELLYDESGATQADSELRDHVRSCALCKKELDDLKAVQKALKVWPDVPPLRPVTVPSPEPKLTGSRFSAFWRVPGYAAAAALLVLAFLSLTNADITWNKQGFSYKSRLFAGSSDYYTKAEVRDILKRVLEDSEARMTEGNFLMMQRLMDTMEQDRVTELKYIRGRSQNSN